MNYCLALLVLCGTAISDPSVAGQQTLLQQVDKILQQTHNEGVIKFNDQDVAGCVKAFRTGLAKVQPMLKSRPELQLMLQVELGTPMPRDEAWKLLDMIKIVRHSLQNAGPLKTDLSMTPPNDELQQARRRVNALGKQAATLKEAVTAYERLIAKEVQCNGAGTPTIAILLNNLGLRYKDLGEFAKALPLHERSVAILEQNEPPAYMPDFLDSLGWAALRMAEFDKAEKAFLKSGTLARAAGQTNPAVAKSLHSLAQLAQSRGQYDKALRHYQDCMAIYKALPDQASRAKVLPEWIRCLNDLASLHMDTSDYSAALQLLQESLSKCSTHDYLGLAQCREHLAVLHVAKGEYDQAEKEYKTVLKLVEAHPAEFAICQNGLAHLYLLMERHDDAQPLYERNLRFFRDTLGADHPEVANSLSNLALLHRAKKEYARAEPLFRKCLDIRRTKLTENHPLVANALNNLAALYSVTGKSVEAKQLYLTSLVIQKRTLGPDSRDVATTLDNLGLLHHKMGDFDAAEKRLQEGLKIRQAKLPEIHADTALSHNHLALVYAAQGRFEQAGRDFDKDRRIVRQYVTRVLPMLTSVQQLRYLRLQEEKELAPALSLGYYTKGNAETLAKSAEWLLNGKAIAHQVMAESNLFARGSKDKAVAALLQDLEVIRRQLARLTLVEDQQQYARLNKEEQNLVVQLQRHGSQLASSQPWVEFTSFCRHLPQDAAFIDIARFQPFDFKSAPGRRKQEARYVAWITLPNGKVELVDLGQAQVIDALIHEMLKQMDEAPKLIRAQGEPDAEKQLLAVLEPFAERVLHPLLKHIGSQKRWILSPDGNLWLVPWNALPLPNGKKQNKNVYAIEKHTISYVTSGRDLVAAMGSDVKAGPAVIFADPDFDLDKKSLDKAVAELRDKDGSRALLRTGELGAFLRGNVARLPGSRPEAMAAKPSLKLFTGVEPELYLEEKANKENVRKVNNPRVLLLSTHGFFLPKSGKDTSMLDNPLLRCGLLFAGCNDKQAREQGIMTGLEVLDMDLRGCELVVLSACQTGLGDTLDGEGVAGLRQCFQLAGANSVVGSLWNVPDLATKQLMEQFFGNLAKNNQKAEALAEAQRYLIKMRSAQHGATHPFFWAAFTLTGQHR